MENSLDEPVVKTLLSANKAGLIEFPPGPALKKDAFVERLKLLQKMGFVWREKSMAFYRPYRLTQKGETLKRILLKAEQVPAVTD